MYHFIISYHISAVINNLANRDILVVTFNYRLGALGYWVDTQNREVGNYGQLKNVMLQKYVYSV